ncbi:MAG: trypsin-like serine protease [Reyranellales bacterium]
MRLRNGDRRGKAEPIGVGRRRLVSGIAASATLAAARPAGSVIILDSTWRAEGGRPGRESAGFRAHIALANQPQFAGLVSFSYDGETWGAASGTWIGNMGGQGLVLTAAHVYEPGDLATEYVYRTGSGSVRRGVRLDLHPVYNWNNEETTGYDFAIVWLDGPVTDSGPPPALYAGTAEEGARIVMVGYGNRGIGSVGEAPEYYTPSDKAAAENTVDEVIPAVRPVPEDEDAGNWFGVTLHREGEGASRLDGILGAGDSGGSAWIRTAGGWAIAGVNSNGGETYDAHAYFARVSGARDWIGRFAPIARFIA